MNRSSITVENPDTQFLRAFAILLIINSHLDRYYPIPYIGTGGAIGNSIFFFLSAYGLYISQQTHRKRFAAWFNHRIGRIYPSLWIVLISLYLPVMTWKGELYYGAMTRHIGDFFNPPFWFLQYLMIYYLLTYRLLDDTWGKSKYFLIWGLLLLVYACCYVTLVDLSRWSVEESPFDMIHYLMVFIYGIYLARDRNSILYSGVHDYLILLVILGLFYGQKYLMLKNYSLEYQFMQQMVMYPILYYLIKISRSPFVGTTIMGSPAMSRVIYFIANRSLEIYMVHQTISSIVLYWKLQFPVNVFLLLFLTICISAIVNKLANTVRMRVA